MPSSTVTFIAFMLYALTAAYLLVKQRNQQKHIDYLLLKLTSNDDDVITDDWSFLMLKQIAQGGTGRVSREDVERARDVLRGILLSNIKEQPVADE